MIKQQNTRQNTKSQPDKNIDLDKYFDHAQPKSRPPSRRNGLNRGAQQSTANQARLSVTRSPSSRTYKGLEKKNSTENKFNSSRRHVNTRKNEQQRNTRQGFNRPRYQAPGSHQRPLDEQKLRIIPLGGCEEVGRNMTLFEYGDDIVILDMGLQFPEEDMPGIDYIIPNISYLKGKEKNVRGVIFSHGHLDHIGAAPMLLEKLGNPVVIGRDLTLAMVKRRVEDYKQGMAKNLKTISVKTFEDKIKLGSLTIGFFQIEHSIMDAVGVIFYTPQGTIIHPGDWTMDRDRQGKSRITYTHLTKFPGPTILMAEALGATDVRPSVPSEIMFENLKKIMLDAPGRIIIGTFSSQIERVKWVLEMAQKIGKKVALDGYSMKMNVEIAKKLGYIKVQNSAFLPINKIDSVPDKKVVVVCTGAQGEGNAVLSRIVSGSHRSIKIKKQDTIIFSSSIIPGNERTIQRLKDNLYRKCDNVIHVDIMDIHTSGHATREDIKDLLRQIRPDYFIPVYANHYFLKEAEKLAISMGFNEKNIVVPDNGSVIELYNKHLHVSKDKVPTNYVFVDGLGIGDVSDIVIRDRTMMAQDGMIVVIMTIDGKTGQLIHSPDLISRGFIYLKENKALIEETRKKVRKIVNDTDPKIEAFTDFLKNKIRNDVGQFLFTKTERRPMILPVVIEV